MSFLLPNFLYKIKISQYRNVFLGFLPKINFLAKKILWCFFIVFLANSCQPKPLLGAFTGLGFTKDIRSVKIPFRIINNLVIIPLHINNSDSLFFILDTGVKTTLITELDSSQALELNYARHQKIRGLGEGDELEAIHSYSNRFYLPHILGKNQDILVLTEDIFFLTSKLGTHVNGLIGYDIFQNLVVEIDPIQRKMTLHQASRFRKPKNFESMDIELEGGKPYIYTKIHLNGKWIDVKLLVDTGASHAISLEKNEKKGIDIPQKNIDAYLGRGLSGEVKGKMARIDGVKFGRFDLKNVISAFPDSVSMGGLMGINHRNGSLGSDFLRRFYVIFDYPNKKMYFKPNNEYKNAFHLNMSGMELSMPVPNFPIYVISQISPDMPAHRAKLKLGDEILKINGSSVFGMNLNQINELFHSKEGRKINLVIRRNELIFKTSIVLEAKI